MKHQQLFFNTIIVLLSICYSCKEKRTKPNSTISIPIKQLNIEGKWKLDSTWVVKNGVKKAQTQIIDITWAFENNTWKLITKPVHLKSNEYNISMDSPLTKIESRYSVYDSILTLNKINLKYKILKIEPNKLYLKDLLLDNKFYNFSLIRD